jgi:uncharacterized membrane protein YcaP (DUF421 family)
VRRGFAAQIGEVKSAILDEGFPTGFLMFAVVRAVLGYLFLILILRVVGRRPGKQLTPFEFVLIFFIGGLALTAIVGDERSLTSALGQLIAIAFTHYCLSWARSRYPRFARITDGTPLVLLQHGLWRSETLSKMCIQDTDVMFAARDHGLEALEKIELAILERNGEISILPRETE